MRERPAPVRLFLALCLLLAEVPALAEPLQEIPALHGRVTDLTGTLNAQEQSALDAKLARLERDTGSQLAVLIVATTQPEDIAAYSIRVADAWRLGRKGVDDGVLLLVARNDRRMRVEVGYGLEGAVPDARARRIVDEIMAPQFKRGNFAAGIDAGVDAIAALIRGEPLPAPGSRDRGASELEGLLPTVLVIALALGGVLRRSLGAVPGAAATGGLAGLVAWLLVGLLGAAILAGVIAFFISLVFGGGPGSWSNRSGYGGGFGGGGFGRGGGGFGGGGFGGGGGGFGGGGASGRW
jgi:uncharacterized protein